MNKMDNAFKQRQALPPEYQLAILLLTIDIDV